MKKKLLKLAIIFFILFESNNFIYANEKIILPEKKPIIIEEEATKKITNYLIPLEKPTSKLEKAKTKKIKKISGSLGAEITGISLKNLETNDLTFINEMLNQLIFSLSKRQQKI